MSSKLPKKLKNSLVVRRVVGHSMLPTLPPGTLVIATGWLRKPKPGLVVIIEHDGKEKIKRIQKHEDDQIYVIGDHEIASTDSRHFGHLDVDTIKARVFWPRTKNQG